MERDLTIIEVTTRCMFCEREHVTEVGRAEYRRWQAGENIQNVFPHLSADSREILISGTCPWCWKKHMGVEL